MTFKLPDFSLAILARIDVQDRERFARNKARAAQIREYKTRIGLLAVGDMNRFNESDLAEFEQLERQIAILELQKELPSLSGGQLRASLNRHRGIEWKPSQITPKLAKDETARGRIALSLDREIDGALVERKAVMRNSNPTLAEMLGKAKTTIASLSAKGQPKVAAGGALVMPSVALPAKSGYSMTQVPDGVALVCWLFQNELEAKVESLLELSASDDAMTTAERKAALADIDARLLGLHRERAALVEEAVANGTLLFHRPDADFRAVLQISN